MLSTLKQAQANKALTRLLVEAKRTATHGLYPMQRVTADRFAESVQVEIDMLERSGHCDYSRNE